MKFNVYIWSSVGGPADQVMVYIECNKILPPALWWRRGGLRKK